MSYIVFTEQGTFREWTDEAHPPKPGDWLMGDTQPERVEVIADGPDAMALDDYWDLFQAELDNLKRLMRN